MVGTFLVDTVSCVDDELRAYSFSAEDIGLYRIGYVSRADQFGDDRIPIHLRDKFFTVEAEDNVVVALQQPITKFQVSEGRSLIRF